MHACMPACLCTQCLSMHVVTPCACLCACSGCGVLETSPCPGTDLCPNDPLKSAPGVCGCGVSDVDTDLDQTPNCQDACPTDPTKTQPGWCGCGTPDTDTNSNGVADCIDPCLVNPCANGGTCEVAGSSFNCQCTGGFTGELCASSGSCAACMYGTSGPCRHLNDGSCFPYLPFTTICPTGTRMCEEGGNNDGGGGTDSGTGSGTGSGSDSGSDSGTGSDNGGGDGGGDDQSLCTACIGGSSGSCRNPANGVCYEWADAARQTCFSGTVACSVTSLSASADDSSGHFSFTVAGLTSATMDDASITAITAAVAAAMDVNPAGVTVVYAADAGSSVRIGVQVAGAVSGDPNAAAVALATAVRGGGFQAHLQAAGLESVSGVSGLEGSAAAAPAAANGDDGAGATTAAATTSGSPIMVALVAVGAVVAGVAVMAMVVVRRSTAADRVQTITSIPSTAVHAVRPQSHSPRPNSNSNSKRGEAHDAAGAVKAAWK